MEDRILYDWTTHGGRLEQARKAFPEAQAPWLDLSTGINPVAWPGVAALDIDWHRLPDESALARLEAAAARHFGAHGSKVLALPGTEYGLRSLQTLGLPAPFRHVAPGYRTHGDAFPGSSPIGFADVGTEALKGGTILLANPANPDGRLVNIPDLLELVSKLAAQGGWLVIDEAFIDAHADGSILSVLSGYEPVIVLRSFGKFFGLAGVRLGFAVGHAAIIDKWRTTLGSWPVSAAAISIGTAAYSDTSWINQMRGALTERAAALDAVLRRHGLQPQGSSPLFRLVECDAAVLFDRLVRRGILTRPFDYDPRWLRLGVPASGSDLDRLDQALGNG